MQVAVASTAFSIPYFCWHPHLSVPGNCRICMVEVEEADGGGWFDIACNMPVSAGMRVFTDSRRRCARCRKDTLQFITLNHPVDCGICDKAGECTLQDYHYAYNGEPSISRDAQDARDQVLPLSEPHHARQRALHPVHALRAVHARSLEVARAGRRSIAATIR